MDGSEGFEGSAEFAEDAVVAGSEAVARDVVVAGAEAALSFEGDDAQALTPTVDAARTAAAIDALMFIGFPPRNCVPLDHKDVLSARRLRPVMPSLEAGYPSPLITRASIRSKVSSASGGSAPLAAMASARCGYAPEPTAPAR